MNCLKNDRINWMKLARYEISSFNFSIIIVIHSHFLVANGQCLSELWSNVLWQRQWFDRQNLVEILWQCSQQQSESAHMAKSEEEKTSERFGIFFGCCKILSSGGPWEKEQKRTEWSILWYMIFDIKMSVLS